MAVFPAPALPALVLIPARMAATRLPGKPLADIAGEPMIVHVWRRAVEAGIGRVAVATDSREIAEAVAKAGGEAISTATSGPHGGNMDYRLFGPGTTAWFPVFAPGALFFLGDCHATQGDGEITGTGIETAFEVEVRLTVEKGRRIGWPRGETSDDIFACGNARPLDQALQHATTEMLAWLNTDYGLDVTAASHLLGQVVRYDIGNVYDPAYTMACRVAKKWLPPRRTK